MLRSFLCFLFVLRLLAAAEAPPVAQASAAFERGDLVAAEQILRAGLKAHPNDAVALGLLGVVLDSGKKFAEAETAYRQALSLAPGSKTLLNNYGNHLVAARNDQAARGVFLKLAALDPENINANLQLARLELKRKAAPEALRYLDRLPPREREDAAVAILRMQALYSGSRLTEAEELYRRLSAAMPGNPQLSFSTGLALAEAGQYEKAETVFSMALEAAPSTFDILYNLGLAAFRAGHHARAHQVLDGALRQRPEDVDVLYAIAAVEAESQQREASVVRLAKAARLSPKRADVQLLLARTTFDLGYRADALQALDRYLKLVPGDEIVRRERGFTAALIGLKEQSLADLEWYVGRHPADPTGHYELGIALSAIDSEKASAEFARALELNPDLAAARFARGVMNYRDAKTEAAVPDLEFAVARMPDNAKALDRLGQAYSALGRHADAVRVLRRAGELAPNDSGILLHLGRALTNGGEQEEARIVLARFRQLGPNRGDLRKPAGLVDFLSLSPEEQYTHYRAKVEGDAQKDPSDVAVQLRYLKLLLDDGDTAKSAAVAHGLLSLQAEPGALGAAGHMLVEAEEYGLAKDVLAPAVARGASPEAQLDLAIAEFHSAGPQAALERMNRVPEAQRTGDYYLARAQMLDQAGRFADAVAALNLALRAAPKRADLYHQANLFLIKNNRIAEALKLLEQAVRLLPDDPNVLLEQATTLELARKTEEAEALLKRIETRWPEWPNGWLAHGIILETHKRYDDARQMIETAMTLGARSAEAYFYLAESTLLTAPERIGDAESAIVRALELAPADPWAWALAGRIALQKAQYEKAVEQLREAIRLRPTLSQAHYNLAQAYGKVGRQADSQAELEQVRLIHQTLPNEEEVPADMTNLFQVKPPRKW